MTRLATILLLAAFTKAQFAGDAAAGGTATKPNPRYNRGLRLPDGIYNRRLRRPRRRRWTRSDEARTNFPRSCTEILSSMDDLDDNSLGT